MGSSKPRLSFFGDHQNLFQFHLISHVPFQFLDPDEIPFGNPIFPSPGFHHRIHETPPH
jgi:hypothetical protein